LLLKRVGVDVSLQDHCVHASDGVQSRRHPEIDWILERPSKSHDYGRMTAYFSRELRSLLHTLDYHAEPLYIGKKTPLRYKGQKWEVHEVLYEKIRGTVEHHVHRVHHASTPRATFVVGIDDVAH
jgi:hypothetical protein